MSNNVNHSVARKLSEMSGFALTRGLGKHLRIPLIRGRKKKEMY